MDISFGAGFASEQTGIILNDQMSDFSNPNTTGYYGALPGQANFIKPGKRPLTSMAPTIVANRETGAVRMVIGGAGGTKIPTAISHVTIWLHPFYSRSHVYHGKKKIGRSYLCVNTVV